MIKLYFKLELLLHYFRRYIWLVLLVATTSSVSLIYFDKILSFAARILPTMPQIVGISGLYFKDRLPPLITNQMSYGLTQITENNKVVNSPLVASLEIRNNHKQYIFRLNPFSWHHRARLTAADIVGLYQINNALLSTPAQDTLIIDLEKEFSPLLSLLSQPLLTSNLSGLGQSKLSEIIFRDSYVNSLTLTRLSDNSQTTYRFYPNQNDLATAFKLGEINQFTTNLFPESIAPWRHVDVTTTVDTGSYYTTLFINTEKFSKKQFRQSLAYATPKPTDKNERCLGPISPNYWAYNPQIKEYSYNPARAKELASPEDPKKVNILVTSRDLLPQAEKIKASWKENLSLDSEIIIGDFSKTDYDTILSYGNFNQDPDQYPFWHSTQAANNITKLNNSRIDKLLEEGRATIDEQERKKIYFDFQRYLLEESPAIFINFPTVHTITRVK